MSNASKEQTAPAKTRALHILVVEDNPDIVANMFAFLEPLGYLIDWARTGPSGLEQARTGSHDVIVLDLMLPGMDGLEVCRRLRLELRQQTPVLMLTARGTVDDKVMGFGAGGDDYLVKPFSLTELDVRLRALHRRARGQHLGPVLRASDLEFDRGTGEATRAGLALHLTPTGVKLLAALMSASPRTVTRVELERELWGDNPPNSDALRTHMHALRAAVDKPFSQPLLHTQPGVGYSIRPLDG